MSLWPWPLPGEVTPEQIEIVSNLAKPGDVIVESNAHCWQWVAVSYVFTGSTWVHASLVTEPGRMVTMEGKIIDLPLSEYVRWRSTRLAVVRPPYVSSGQMRSAIQYASSQKGLVYDPLFENVNGSCTGIVGEALTRVGVPVEQERILGHRIFPARAFFHIPGARIIYNTENQPKPSGKKHAVSAQ